MPEIVDLKPEIVKVFPVSFMVITCDADAPHLNKMLATLPHGAEVCILHNKKGEVETLSEVEVISNGAHTIKLRRWVYVGDFHFAQARNLCDELASNDWCMWIDTDDRLAACQHELIESFATNCPAGYGGAWCGVASYEPSWDGMTKGRVTSAYQLRFYRKSVGATWEGRVHEQIHTSIQQNGYATSETSVIVIHTGYMGSVEDRRKKLTRNFDLLTKQVAEGATSPTLTQFYTDALLDTSTALYQLNQLQGKH